MRDIEKKFKQKLHLFYIYKPVRNKKEHSCHVLNEITET